MSDFPLSPMRFMNFDMQRECILKCHVKKGENYNIFIPSYVNYFGLWCASGKFTQDFQDLKNFGPWCNSGVFSQDIQEFSNPQNLMGHVFKMEIRSHNLYNILDIFTNFDWYTTDIDVRYHVVNFLHSTSSLGITPKEAEIQYQLTRKELDVFKIITQEQKPIN